MRRSILTGIFILVLSGSVCSFAAADETAVVPVPPLAESSAVIASPAVAAATSPAQVPAARDSVSATANTAAPSMDTANAGTADVAPAAIPQIVSDRAKPSSRLRRFATGIVNRSSAIASSLTRSAMRFIGTPYVFGGTHATGFDCSGYVQHVYAMLGFRLPRTADAQFDAGRHIARAMVPGDLVFFHTYAPGVSHVGIYLGQSRFIHSSSSRGVAISNLHDSYWAPRYMGAKRMLVGVKRAFGS